MLQLSNLNMMVLIQQSNSFELLLICRVILLIICLSYMYESVQLYSKNVCNIAYHTIVVKEHYPCVLAILVVCEASCFAFKKKRIHTREVIDLSSIHDPRFRKVAFTEILSQRQ